MAVFISHSHQDKAFVDRLATQLVLHKAYVWLDRWEIRVGDSLLDKVQEGIKSSGALIIVLSKASVASEWCRKELNAGLMRELAERRVIVLPLLLEDCEIPLFLRDKMYADFRTDFDAGLRKTLEAISAVTSNSQGRIEHPSFFTDFGIAWGESSFSYCLDLRFIDHGKNIPYCVLTEIKITGNDKFTEKFREYDSKGLGTLGRLIIVTALRDYVSKHNPKPFLLEDSLPKHQNLVVDDPKTGIRFHVLIFSIRLGQDTGMDTLIDWPRHIEMLWSDLIANISPEERMRVREAFHR